MCQHVSSDVSEIAAAGLVRLDLLDLRGKFLDLLRLDVQVALVEGDPEYGFKDVEHRDRALVVHEVTRCLAHETC